VTLDDFILTVFCLVDDQLARLGLSDARQRGPAPLLYAICNLTHGRFLFVPGSAVDQVDGWVLVEAAGPSGVLRMVSFAKGETDEGLDVAQPIVVAGVLAAVRAVGYTFPHRSPTVRAVPPMSEVTRILSAIEHGDPNAAEQLLPLVYDELRQLAAQKLAQEKPGQTLQATALVHEAYLRLVDVQKAQHWNSKRHFLPSRPCAASSSGAQTADRQESTAVLGSRQTWGKRGGVSSEARRAAPWRCPGGPSERNPGAGRGGRTASLRRLIGPRSPGVPYRGAFPFFSCPRSLRRN